MTCERDTGLTCHLVYASEDRLVYALEAGCCAVAARFWRVPTNRSFSIGMEETAMGAVSRWIVASAAALVLATSALSAAAADTVSHDRLMHMIQSAKTPADHEKIAAIYEQQARADQAAAENHRRMERLYKGIDPTAGGRGSGQMAIHCKNIADSYERAAHENNSLAELHRKAAAEVR